MRQTQGRLHVHVLVFELPIHYRLKHAVSRADRQSGGVLEIVPGIPQRAVRSRWGRRKHPPCAGSREKNLLHFWQVLCEIRAIRDGC